MLKKIWLLLNIPAVAALLIAYFTADYDPAVHWIFHFSGLIFPFLVVVNLFFLVSWLVFDMKVALLSLLALAVSVPGIRRNIAFNNSCAPEEGPFLKIMTFNVRNFDLYNWTGNKISRDKIMQIIDENRPDIICFQEFYTEDYGEFENINLLKSLGYTHHHFVTSLRLRDKDNWGIAIFSSYPIQDKGQIYFENSKFNLAATATINWNGTPVHLINVHLQSYHFMPQDIDQVMEFQKDEKRALQGLKKIFDKMVVAAERRSGQIQQIMQEISHPPTATILCGDLNSIPNSYVYRQLSSRLNDTFLQCGKGLGYTYNAGFLPLRIDYIFASEDLTTCQVEVIHEKISDHYPYIATFSLAGPSNNRAEL